MHLTWGNFKGLQGATAGWRRVAGQAGLGLALLASGCGEDPAPASSSASQADTAATDTQAADGTGTSSDACGPAAKTDTTAPDTATADVPATTAKEPLLPGNWQSPLVHLKRLQDKNGHMHVDEVRYRVSDKKLFQCSYTFAVLDASAPASIKFDAQELKHTIPGSKQTPGCIHLAPDDNLVWTTHRGNLSNPTFISGWDISKKSADGKTMAPQQLPVLQEPGESYEGIDVANGYVYVALRLNGLGIYQRDITSNALTRVGSVSGLGSTWGLRVVGNIAYLSDIGGGLATVDVSDPKSPKLLGKVAVSGVAKGLSIAGKVVYLAAGSAGLVAIDVADPAKPKILSQTPIRGTAIRTATSEGRVVVAGWNDAPVFDVANPAAPKFIGAVRLTTELTYPDDEHPPATARTLGVALNGKDLFVGNWWVQYTYRLYPERLAPNLVVPEDANLMDFGPVEPGKSKALTMKISNQGTAPLTLFHIWSTSANFKVKQAQLRLQPGETGTLDLSFAATTTTGKETALLNLYSDDPLQPVRKAFLVANQPGFGVGKPFPETKAMLLDGSSWSSSDVKGKVMLLGYFATFCPVCSVQVKDYESRFKAKYGDKIELIKLDANGDPVDGVQTYVKNLGVTYKIGLEDPTTKTNAQIQVNYKGVNPFPVDVIVGKDGKIVYVAREYDPDAMTAAIDAALAQ